MQKVVDRPRIERGINLGELIMSFWGIVSAVVAFVVICVVIMTMVSASRQKFFDQVLQQIEGFNPVASRLGSDGKTGIAIDAERREMCFLTRAGPTFLSERIPYAMVLSSEICEDGTTLSKTNRGSQLAGAAVGGVLLGGLGAIVGGLSGSSRTVETVRKLELVVTVNDAANPMRRLVFLEGTETKRNSMLYKLVSDAAQEWHARISVAVHNGATSA